MGRIAERVARTDAAHALRLVSAVNDVAVAQQIAQDQRRRQPRTVEPEGFEKRGSRCWRVKASNISRVVPP